MHHVSRCLKLCLVAAAGGFFAVSLAVTAALLLQGGTAHALFLAGATAGLVLGLLQPRTIHVLLWGFGFSLVFFGFQNYMLPTRFLEYETLCLTILLALRNRQRFFRPPASALEWAFWLFPACALTSVVLPLGPGLLEAFRATGALGVARMVTGSPAGDPFYAFGAAWRLALFAAFAWALASGREGRPFRPLLWGVSAGVLASLVVGLGVYLASAGQALSMDGRLTSLFFNPGWYAEYLCMTYPFVVLLFTGRNRSKLLYVFMALAALAVTLTMARAAWLVFLYLVVQTVAMVFKDHAGTTVRGHPYLKGLTVCFSIVLLSALLAYHFLAIGNKKSHEVVLTEKITDRLVHFTDTPRLTVFKSGLLIGLEAPAVGYGFESYAWRYRQLANDPASRLARGIPTGTEAFEAAHNFFIQLFSGIGLFGVLVWLVLVGCAFRRWSGLVRQGDALAGAALTSAIVFHLFGIFQEMTYIPPVWLLMWVLLGHALAADAASEEDRPDGGRTGRRWGWLALAVWVAFALLTGVRQEPRTAGLADCQGLFPPERIEGPRQQWSGGTASLLLAGPGPWEIAFGLPGPVAGGKSLTVWLRGHDGRVLDTAVFGPGDMAPKRFVVAPGALEPGERLYLHADRVFFPPLFQMADQRVLGPSVRIETRP